jgi:glycine/D-amino acid oxidase-like deaminating enzyme
MGLMTAYYAAPASAVTVLEKSSVGDPATASFGLTRSVRNDYRDAGVAAVTGALTAALRRRGVQVAEKTAPCGIARTAGGGWIVATDAGPVESDVLVITAGLGTNEVLGLVPGCSARFPLRPDRPSQSKYFIPAAGTRGLFTEAALPVFAYLDIGIYGHPMYAGKTPGVKIGFYHPPDAALVPSRIRSVEDFVAECVPGLRGAQTVDVAEASGVDACSYDLVADDDFIIGPVPGAGGVYTGVGWRGTGYKFAPWAGLVLARLALQQATGYDIRRFAPARFAGFAGGAAAGKAKAGGVPS